MINKIQCDKTDDDCVALFTDIRRSRSLGGDSKKKREMQPFAIGSLHLGVMKIKMKITDYLLV